MLDKQTSLQGTNLYIYEAVHQALENLMEIRESNPPYSIFVDKGIVTLSGVMPNAKTRNQALMAAARTEKVKRVIDNLRTDAEIERDVAMLLGMDEKLRQTNPIIVTSYNGNVTLTSKTNSEDLVQHAISLAESVSGVVSVINHITIL